MFKRKNKEQLKAWVNTISTMPIGLKTKACAALDKGNITADEMLDAENKDDLKDLGFPGVVTKRLFEALAKIPRQPRKSKKGNKKDPALVKAQLEKLAKEAKEKKRKQKEKEQQDQSFDEKTGDQPSGDEFKVNISVKGKSPIQTNNYFSANTVVSDFIRYLRDTEIGGEADEGFERTGQKCDLRLVWQKKVLEVHRKFSYYNVSANGVMLVAYNVVGGAHDPQDSDEKNRERIPDFNADETIKPTLDPDCIMGYDDNDTLRVEMPCGHVFDPDTIYHICKRILEVHSKSNFRCPVIECNKIWKFEAVAAAADLNKDERLSFQLIIAERQAVACGECKKCPHCTTLMSRPKNLAYLRVRCVGKKCRGKPDFCWICSKPWQGGGFSVCGNKECPTGMINETLQCEDITEKVGARGIITMPQLRACPRCLTLVGYKRACKHMKCWGCKEEFCFACLALKQDGKWGCSTGGSSGGQCEIAPKQVIK